MFSPFALPAPEPSTPRDAGRSSLSMLRVWADPRNAAVSNNRQRPRKRSKAKIERHQETIQEGRYIEQWISMKASYVKARGFTVGRNRKKVPKTTNRDILAVASYWAVSAAVHGKRSRKADRTAYRQWKANYDRVLKQAKGKPLDALYADNQRFWQQDTRRVSIWLDSLGAVPTKAELAWESIAESTVEVPRTIGKAAGVVTDGAVAVGEGVGKVVTAPIAGAADKLGVGVGTLLLGAGAIVAGIILVPKLLRK